MAPSGFVSPGDGSKSPNFFSDPKGSGGPRKRNIIDGSIVKTWKKHQWIDSYGAKWPAPSSVRSITNVAAPKLGRVQKHMWRALRPSFLGNGLVFRFQVYLPSWKQEMKLFEWTKKQIRWARERKKSNALMALRKHFRFTWSLMRSCNDLIIFQNFYSTQDLTLAYSSYSWQRGEISSRCKHETQHKSLPSAFCDLTSAFPNFSLRSPYNST